MREARILGSWTLALFLAGMLIWISIDTIAPAPGAKNHLFDLFAATSGIAYFEPTGRLLAGVLEVLAALLVLIPLTRRLGAFLSLLLAAVMGVLLGQLMMLGLQIPVDAIGKEGAVTTVPVDPGALFYLTLGLGVAAILLAVIHPGRSATGAA